MLSSATNSRDKLSVIEVFSRSDTAYYIRHVLQDVPLQDLSLVDDLIETTEHEFMSAVYACGYIRFGPKGNPNDRMQVLLESQRDPESLIEELFNSTLENLDVDIRTQLMMENPSFSPIVTGGRQRGWLQLCQLHCHIACTCLHMMNKLLCFNICCIPTSYAENNDAHIQELVQLAHGEGQITPALTYACSHWPYHASFVFLEEDEMLMELAAVFLKSHALHWVEILSLTGRDASHVVRPLSKIKVSGLCYF